MILGIAGEKHALAAYLIKEHGFERRAFADPVKRVIAASLGVPYDKIEQIKKDPLSLVDIEAGDFGVQFTFKEFIRDFAEGHKDIFGEDFWLQYTLPLDGFYAGKKIVVTDVKFDNEANRIRMVGGYVVGVYADQKPGISTDHVDYWIVNDHGLTEQTEAMLETLGSKDYNGRALYR